MNWVDNALKECFEKIDRNIEQIGLHFPHVAYDGMIRVLPFGLPDSGRDFFGFYMRKQRVNVHWNWLASWKRKWMMYWMDF